MLINPDVDNDANILIVSKIIQKNLCKQIIPCVWLVQICKCSIAPNDKPSIQRPLMKPLNLFHLCSRDFRRAHPTVRLFPLYMLQRLYGSNISKSLIFFKQCRELPEYCPNSTIKYPLAIVVSNNASIYVLSCYFLTADRAKSCHDEHLQCLRNIVQSWGFQTHHIEGNGNFCFTALAFMLCA